MTKSELAINARRFASLLGPKRPGVYAFKHFATGGVYIGQSKQVDLRILSHFSKITGNRLFQYEPLPGLCYDDILRDCQRHSCYGFGIALLREEAWDPARKAFEYHVTRASLGTIGEEKLYSVGCISHRTYGKEFHFASDIIDDSIRRIDELSCEIPLDFGEESLFGMLESRISPRGSPFYIYEDDRCYRWSERLKVDRVDRRRKPVLIKKG